MSTHKRHLEWRQLLPVAGVTFGVVTTDASSGSGSD
jgi:hypothetical protein